MAIYLLTTSSADWDFLKHPARKSSPLNQTALHWCRGQCKVWDEDLIRENSGIAGFFSCFNLLPIYKPTVLIYSTGTRSRYPRIIWSHRLRIQITNLRDEQMAVYFPLQCNDKHFQSSIFIIGLSKQEEPLNMLLYCFNTKANEILLFDVKVF